MVTLDVADSNRFHQPVTRTKPSADDCAHRSPSHPELEPS
jgi:hypothetical protein